ncbi:TolB family protein [Conexibacter arvalis]|uniref:Uncharacterized protein n=1 Tax=Conexibacter arvalis TaxID=912552 RepID=A0A840IF60_9ACTN|nr:hypothetical protein [Conexibacter arvalis]MBB4662628.1 hypothetical protein [Conexibacter arvalis]
MDERWSSVRPVPAAPGARAAAVRAARSALLATGVASALATGAVAAEPGSDGRVYERVSPAQKGTSAAQDIFAVADDGGSINYTLYGAVEGQHSFGVRTPLRASRTATHWWNDAVTPKTRIVSGLDSNKEAVVLATSSDGATALVKTPYALEERDEDEEQDLYLLDISSGEARLVSAAESGHDAAGSKPYMAGVTNDLSVITFRQADPLTPDAPTNGGVYQWRDGAITLVSRNSDDDPVAPAATQQSDQRTSMSSVQTFEVRLPHGGMHNVSDDGSVVFWQATALPTQLGRLFARIDGNTTIAYTTSQRSASGGTPAGTHPTATRFLGAKPDGSAVYFSSTEMLADDATQGGGIYRYTFADGRLSQVTSASIGGTNVAISSAMISGDGTHVYFVSNQRLTADAGTFNGYVWSETGGTRLVAAFGGGAPRIERVGRDGRFALFETAASVNGALTGGNRVVYRYDAQEGELLCASCRPDGSAAETDTLLNIGIVGRNLSDDGEVYFTTADRLVEADVNGVRDVYAFDGHEPLLISSGRGSVNSHYGDSSDDGIDVFFVTREQLADDDIDDLNDVYTARRGGGFPPLPEDPVIPCRGTACVLPAPVPDFATPASELLDGVGNVDEPAIALPSLRLQPIGTAARKRFARTGATVVRVRTTTKAKVNVTLRVRMGGRWVRSARAAKALNKAGTAKVRVALTRRARRALASAGALRVRIEARSSRTTGTVSRGFVLRLSSRAKGAR